jgi:6-hydroxy-3-succinoylpyridine 3-monooxygenase
MADTSVVVVGAGPVGLITALGLARAGVDVTLFEAAQPANGAPSAHDMIYHWSVLPGLQRLGVLSDMCAAGLIGRMWTILVAATGERITIDLSEQLAGRVAFPHTVHLDHDRLVEVVLPHLRRCGIVQLHSGTRVTGVAPDAAGVTITAEGPRGKTVTRADWLVGTDGAHSVVRRSLGIGFAGWTWPQRFVATTTKFDWATVGFTEATHRVGGPWPAVAGRADAERWRFVYAEPRSLAQESIEERMPMVFRDAIGDDDDPRLQAWSAYRVHERAAASFRSGRVLLAGDAAHVTNPTLSLGLASGLLDSFVLSEALAAVIHGEQDDNILDEYATQRRRSFCESISPLSSRTMHVVLGTGSAQDEATLQLFRRAAHDPDALLELYSENGELETPSLV